VVSEWFFKSQPSTRVSHENPVDKRPRAESSSQQQMRSEQDSSSLKTVSISTDNVMSTHSAIISAEVHGVEDMESTIVTANSPNSVGSESVSPNVIK
jgi:hypothetical protein